MDKTGPSERNICTKFITSAIEQPGLCQSQFREEVKLTDGMQQTLLYAGMLDVPFAISSNGDGFLLHDSTGLTQPVEREVSLEEKESA